MHIEMKIQLQNYEYLNARSQIAPGQSDVINISCIDLFVNKWQHHLSTACIQLLSCFHWSKRGASAVNLKTDNVVKDSFDSKALLSRNDTSYLLW